MYVSTVIIIIIDIIVVIIDVVSIISGIFRMCEGGGRVQGQSPGERSGGHHPKDKAYLLINV